MRRWSDLSSDEQFSLLFSWFYVRPFVLAICKVLRDESPILDNGDITSSNE